MIRIPDRWTEEFARAVHAAVRANLNLNPPIPVLRFPMSAAGDEREGGVAQSLALPPED